MAKDYIEERNGGYYVAGTRVSLDSVIYGYLRGESPEGIVESFPALTLEHVFGALSYYLANQDSMDKYLADGRAEFDALREQWKRDNPAFYRKLMETRSQVVHIPLQ